MLRLKKKSSKQQGRGNGVLIQAAIAMPVLTLLLSALAAKLILSGTLSEDSNTVVAAVIAGVTAFVSALYCAIRMPQKKLLWGLLITAAYGAFLLLGNLLFFGVAYGNLGGVLLPVFCAGLIGSLIGAAKKKKRKFA